MIELIFWASAGFVVYAYLGYLLALSIVAAVSSRPVRRAEITPKVSLIITARNEEARIAAKLDEVLSLDYPKSLVDVIVASDCSTDGTHRLVAGYEGRGVRLVVAPERRGKEFAQKCAIDASTGDILVFSDVATRMDVVGLRRIASNFADPTVGCVSSVDRVVRTDGQVSGEGIYVRYEMHLRALESTTASVVGLSGSFFAARRAVCSPWHVDLPSDFTTLLNTLDHRLRGISDPTAIGYYSDLADPAREYRRKVRTITRGIRALLRNAHVLNPFSYGLMAWQLFSHKVCRWLVPFALLGMLASSVVLFNESPIYAASALLQCGAYGLAAVGYRKQRDLSLLTRTVTFFALANVSIMNAWLNVLRGRDFVTWEPSQRAHS